MSKNRLYFDLLAKQQREREVDFWSPKRKDCPVCYGVGEIEGHTKEGNYYTCKNCGGNGYINL